MQTKAQLEALKRTTAGRAMPVDYVENEAWRPVAGWEKFHRVSSLGRICSLIGGIPHLLRGHLTPNAGYLIVALCDDPIRRYVTVHSLVAAAFLGPRDAGQQVNHKDGDKANNSAVNLEYVTQSENIQHGYAIGAYRPGEGNGRSKLSEVDVVKMRVLASEGVGATALGRRFCVSKTTAQDIVARRLWKHVA